MSYRVARNRPNLLRAFSLVLALLWVALVLGACEPQVDPEAGYKSFLTAVAKAPDDGYSVYWLGREFQAGGLTFKGPSADDSRISAFSGGGGVEFGYGSHIDGLGGVSLDIYLYSPNAWAGVKDSQLPAHEARRGQDLTIAGARAQMFALADGTRPVNQRRLYVMLKGTMVVVIAASGGPATPGGPDVNPLIDEQTFLSVVRNLRPYPQ